MRVEVGLLGATDRARVSGLRAVTLHRLLGYRPGTSARFKHHRGNRLPHGVIVVDETSMVSLTMMARLLLEAVRPQTRLILVGDPDRLASVEAGAVLADLVDGLGGRDDVRIAELRTSHRFGASIGQLAQAVRAGDADEALDYWRPAARTSSSWTPRKPTAALQDLLVANAMRIRAAAAASDPAAAWPTSTGTGCCARTGWAVRGCGTGTSRSNGGWPRRRAESFWAQWYLGRPVLVTANDYGLGLYNGDTGVCLLVDRGLRVAVTGADRVQEFATSRLSEVETMHADNSQESGQSGRRGDRADAARGFAVAVAELLYTAVTRARRRSASWARRPRCAAPGSAGGAGQRSGASAGPD